LIERLRRSRRLDDLVIATSDRAENAPLAELCERLACRVYRGSEEDVLGRMVAAAGDADIVVRLTGDNPFVDGLLVDDLIDFFEAGAPLDYAANIEDSGYPYGLYAEVVGMDALHLAMQSDDPMDREHVTWFLRRHPEQFHRATMKADADLSAVSLTVDTEDDYRRLAPVFAEHFARNEAFTYRDVMAALTRATDSKRSQ
jgi:spore coat polysaccharide biosynthesis protein SpsF